jgi:hypothetical protein
MHVDLLTQFQMHCMCEPVRLLSLKRSESATPASIAGVTCKCLMYAAEVAAHEAKRNRPSQSNSGFKPVFRASGRACSNLLKEMIRVLSDKLVSAAGQNFWNDAIYIKLRIYGIVK